jgi:hypothetical protein
LEKLGGSVQQVLSHFPPDQFTVLGRAEADNTFRPFSVDEPLTQDRFFILARRHSGKSTEITSIRSFHN